jgi:hypothetical protein
MAFEILTAAASTSAGLIEVGAAGPSMAKGKTVPTSIKVAGVHLPVGKDFADLVHKARWKSYSLNG